MEECVFCKIVRGEIKSYRVYEDEEFLGFLDAFPSMNGQVLVIPKKHIAPYLFGVDDELYTKIMLVSKKVANAIDRAIKPIKTGLIIEGLEVEHVHVKLYPLFKPFGIKQMDSRPSEQEMEETAKKITESI